VPQPTALCDLWSTRISRQEVPRLPPVEGYSETSGQGRSFLVGFPEEVSRTQTLYRGPVVRSCCSPPARYRRRTTGHGFSEPRRLVSGTPNNRAQSVGGLHLHQRPPNLDRARCEGTGVSTPRPSMSDSPAIAQSPWPQNRAVRGHVQAHGHCTRPQRVSL
jgi:hypothetical protein